MQKRLKWQPAQQLREERLRYNWSQQDLADRLGTTTVTISRWENGASAPSPYFRLKLQKLFGKSFEASALTPEADDTVHSDQDKEEVITSSDQPEKDEPPSDQLEFMHATQEPSTDTSLSSSFPLHQKQWFSRRTVLLLVSGATITSVGSFSLLKLFSSQRTTASAARHPTPSMTTLYVYTPDGYNVNYVVWSPRGGFLACANGDKTVRILNATTGGTEMVYRKHTGYAECVTWAPDETHVASASGDGTVQVWKPTNGEQAFVYRGHSGPVYCVVWSHDGTRIASGGKDTTVQVWDAFTGEHIITYRGHTQGVWDISWSPNDESIASGGEDGIIRVWDSRTAQKSPTFVYQGPQGRTNEIDWSPGGHYIASAHVDATVRIWDALTGSAIFTYTGHTTSVITARWSPDGVYIASGSLDGIVHIWNASTGKRVFTYQKHVQEIYEVSWAPDGKHLAIAAADQTMDVCTMIF